MAFDEPKIGTGSGDLIYQWWCPRCQCDHCGPTCPQNQYVIEYTDANRTYDICPHCGKEIK